MKEGAFFGALASHEKGGGEVSEDETGGDEADQASPKIVGEFHFREAGTVIQSDEGDDW